MMEKRVLMIACLLLLAWCGCRKKDGPTGPQGATGPQGEAGTAGYRGVIAGHVFLYDQDGARIEHGLDSIRVSLNDSVATAADKDGYYVFTNVATGNYTIKVSDAGYGNTQSGNFAFIKDTVYKDLQLSQKPDFEVTALSIKRQAGFPDLPYMTTAHPGALHSLIVFVSKSPQVSSSNYLLYYSANRLSYSPIRIPFEDYLSAGIFYGDTVYYAAYSYIQKDYSTYIDDKTGRQVFTAVGTPALDTLMAP